LVSGDGDGGIPAIRHLRPAAITERTFRELRLASLANLRADSRARRSTVRVILLYRRISKSRSTLTVTKSGEHPAAEV